MFVTILIAAGIFLFGAYVARLVVPEVVRLVVPAVVGSSEGEGT